MSNTRIAWLTPDDPADAFPAVDRALLEPDGRAVLLPDSPAALAALPAIAPSVDALVTHLMTLVQIAAVFREGPPAGSMKVQLEL